MLSTRQSEKGEKRDVNKAVQKVVQKAWPKVRIKLIWTMPAR